MVKLLQFFILNYQWILGIVRESSFYLPLTVGSIIKEKIKSRLSHTFQKSFSGTFRVHFYDQYNICCTVINRIYTRNCFFDLKTMKWIPVSFIGILIRIQRFYCFVLNKDLHESLRSPLLIHFSSSNFGLPWCSAEKYPPNNRGDTDSFPGLGRFPGDGNGNPFQRSCLGNATDRGAGGL